MQILISNLDYDLMNNSEVSLDFICNLYLQEALLKRQMERITLQRSVVFILCVECIYSFSPHGVIIESVQLFIFLWLKQYIPAAVTNSLHGDLSVFIWMAYSKEMGLPQFLTGLLKQAGYLCFCSLSKTWSQRGHIMSAAALSLPCWQKRHHRQNLAC